MLSKKPGRTFISMKPRVRFKAIHHGPDEHATLPPTSPPCHWRQEEVCPSMDLRNIRSKVLEQTN